MTAAEAQGITGSEFHWIDFLGGGRNSYTEEDERQTLTLTLPCDLFINVGNCGDRVKSPRDIIYIHHPDAYHSKYQQREQG